MGGRILWGLIGVLSIVGGFLALANPFGASVAATVIAGWTFIIVGILELVGIFSDKSMSGKIWVALLGILAIWVGFAILNNPLQGMVLLTTVVAFSFLALGVFKAVLAFSIEHRGAFWLVLISGVVSALLGVVILTNFPVSAVTALGLLLGIDLLSNGATMIAVAIAGPPEGEAA